MRTLHSLQGSVLLGGQIYAAQALPAAQTSARAREMNRVENNERQGHGECRLLLWRPQVEAGGPGRERSSESFLEEVTLEQS